jgi:DNA-binding MarR family transcriptional regulator
MEQLGNTGADSIDRCIADVTGRFPEIDPAVEGVIDRMNAIGKHVSRIFEETLARHGLSHGEYKLLMQLAVAPAPSQVSAGDLSRALLLSSGGMTSRLDKLESAALIRRVPDPRDRRGVLVELTPAGATLIDEAVAEQAAKEIEVLRSLTARELGTLNGLLRKVLGPLESRPALEQRGATVG